MKSVLVVLFGIIFMCDASTHETNNAWEEALFVLSGARNIRYGDGERIRTISYDVSAGYPAVDVLEQIYEHFRIIGWKVLYEHPYLPGWKNSHAVTKNKGWSRVIDVSRGARTTYDQWVGEWEDKKGSVVSYVLQFSAGENSNKYRSTLQVTALFYPPDIAADLRDKALKQDADELAHAKILDYRNLNAAFLAEAKRGELAAIQFILSRGIDINYASPKDNITALMKAIEGGHTEIIRFLLSKGADPNIIRADGLTPLILAVQKNNLVAAQELLKNGANSKMKFSGMTALMIARQRNYAEMVRILQRYGLTE